MIGLEIDHYILKKVALGIAIYILGGVAVALACYKKTVASRPLHSRYLVVVCTTKIVNLKSV